MTTGTWICCEQSSLDKKDELQALSVLPLRAHSFSLGKTPAQTGLRNKGNSLGSLIGMAKGLLAAGTAGSRSAVSSGSCAHPLNLTQASWLCVSSHTGLILSSTWRERWLPAAPSLQPQGSQSLRLKEFSISDPTEGSDWPCLS